MQLFDFLLFVPLAPKQKQGKMKNLVFSFVLPDFSGSLGHFRTVLVPLEAAIGLLRTNAQGKQWRSG
jgi:hypothetical protein